MVNYHNLAYDSGLIIGEDYYQSAFVHDEYQNPCKEEKADILCRCLEQGAAQVTEDLHMNLPIAADAVVGKSWADTH